MALQVREQLLEQFDRLSDVQQIQLLKYAISIGGPQKGIAGKDLLPFAGCISEEDADMMMQSVQEGCERIEPNEW